MSIPEVPTSEPNHYKTVLRVMCVGACLYTNTQRVDKTGSFKVQHGYFKHEQDIQHCVLFDITWGACLMKWITVQSFITFAIIHFTPTSTLNLSLLFLFNDFSFYKVKQISLGNNTLEGEKGDVSILECKQACTGLGWNFREFLVGLLVTLPNNVLNTLISCKKCQCKRQILPTHNFCNNKILWTQKKRETMVMHVSCKQWKNIWITRKLNKWTKVIPKSNTDFNYT
jgi:hypothetical protein